MERCVANYIMRLLFINSKTYSLFLPPSLSLPLLFLPPCPSPSLLCVSVCVLQNLCRESFICGHGNR